MELFWKSCASVLVALILILAVGRQERDMSVLLAIASCCIAGMSAIQMLTPTLDFLYELQSNIQIDVSMIRILLKIVSVGLVAELISLICADAGNTSLGKVVQLLASSTILSLSIPVFRNMLELIHDILGGL